MVSVLSAARPLCVASRVCCGPSRRAFGRGRRTDDRRGTRAQIDTNVQADEALGQRRAGVWAGVWLCLHRVGVAQADALYTHGPPPWSRRGNALSLLVLLGAFSRGPRGPRETKGLSRRLWRYWALCRASGCPAHPPLRRHGRPVASRSGIAHQTPRRGCRWDLDAHQEILPRLLRWARQTTAETGRQGHRRPGSWATSAVEGVRASSAELGAPRGGRATRILGAARQSSSPPSCAGQARGHAPRDPISPRRVALSASTEILLLLVFPSSCIPRVRSPLHPLRWRGWKRGVVVFDRPTAVRRRRCRLDTPVCRRLRR